MFSDLSRAKPPELTDFKNLNFYLRMRFVFSGLILRAPIKIAFGHERPL